MLSKGIVRWIYAGFFSVAILAAVSPTRAEEVRTWVDDQNRKVDAALVAVKGDEVVLRLKNGKELDFPINKLSAADKEYLNKHLEEMKEAASKPRLNFEERWPEQVSFKDDPEVEDKTEDKESNRFVYESANYRFICDVKLASSVVRGFARLFEATHKYCLELPLGMSGGRQIDGKYQILLFEQEANYIKEGGPPGSAGVFMGKTGVIMVPLESLGVRKVGKTFVLDRDRTNKTLPHEITHQLTPNNYYAPGSVGWFTEGIAEYVAVTPYTMGTYNVRMNQKALIEYVTGFGKGGKGGRAIGKNISLPPIQKYFLQTYQSFLADPQKNYGSGALLAYYFFHFDGDGDGKRIKAYLAALHEGKHSEEALQVLLDGRTYEQLQNEIIEKWKAKGVNFSFSS